MKASMEKLCIKLYHDDIIKWKHFPRYWPFVRGIHRSSVNSPHKGQWRGALMFSLICVWINGWVNNRGAGDLRRYRAHYDVTVMMWYGALPYRTMDITGSYIVILGAFEFWLLKALQNFLSMDEIFCAEFQRVLLKFHTKHLTHISKDAIFENLKYLRFKNSNSFLKRLSVKTLKHGKQGDRHFADDILKCIFFNEEVWISIGFSHKLMSRIDNKPALIHVIAWRRTGDKPLSEPFRI